MRLLLVSTAVVQLAMHQVWARPTFNKSPSSSFKMETSSSGSHSNHHFGGESMDANRAPFEQQTHSAVDHSITRKDKHKRLAAASVSRATKEAVYGFTGSAKSIGYGMREGGFRAKASIKEFQDGSKRKGAKYMVEAVGKAGEGVVMSTVPAVGGLGAAVYSGGKAVIHGISTVKASVLKKKDSTTPLQQVLDEAHAIRDNTPVREQTKRIVNSVMRTHQDDYFSSPEYSPKPGRRTRSFSSF